MLEDYVQHKSSLEYLIADLSKFAVNNGNHIRTLEVLEERKERLRQDMFNLVVLGQYKRGKTTFINALLGADILPTAIVPLTSIVTVIRYGREMIGRVQFQDGTIKPIALQDLAQYVTETENPENGKLVKLVEITYPSAYLNDGVRIIDTPGIGSVHQHNTDATYEFLPRVDAAIFVLTADPPISREECSFLKEVIQHVRQVFFVQNKIDLVADNDCQQSLLFSKNRIEQLTGFKDVTIYPVSAKQALEGTLNQRVDWLSVSHINEFKNALSDFFIKDRKTVLLSSTAYLIIQMINEALLKINLEYSTINLPLVEIKGKLNTLHEHFQGVQQGKADMAYLLKGELERFGTQLETDLKEFKEKASAQVKEKLKDFVQERKQLGMTELTVSLNHFLAQTLVMFFQEWQTVKEQEANAWLDAVAKRFESKNNALIAEIRNLAADLFQIQFQAVAGNILLTRESSLYFLTEINQPLFSFPSGILHSLLPKAWSLRLLLKSGQEQAEELVDLNCGRIRYDVHSRMKKSLNVFKKKYEESLDQTINEIVGTIEAAIQKKSLGEELVQRRKDELGKDRDTLRRMLQVAEKILV
jgi:GTP-binding protein EngB required for normal cell division